MSIDVIIERRHRHREEQRRRANSEHDFDALKRIDVVLVHYITKRHNQDGKERTGNHLHSSSSALLN